MFRGHIGQRGGGHPVLNPQLVPPLFPRLSHFLGKFIFLLLVQGLKVLVKTNNCRKILSQRGVNRYIIIC